MTLADWMESQGFDDAALGERIDRSRVAVSRYRRKLEIPSAETIKRIVELSGGCVTANELLQIESTEAAQ